MATLTNGFDLATMYRSGWTIIRADTAISLGDFRAELEATTQYDRDDWDTGQAILSELEYLPPASAWTAHRDFWAAAPEPQMRAIAGQARERYRYSRAAITAKLIYLRDGQVNERIRLTDLIQNELLPFATTPPPGTAAGVLQAVDDAITRARNDRNKAIDTIEYIDNSLASI